MVILRSVGPVISTRRSRRYSGIGATAQSPERTSAVSSKKPSDAPAATASRRVRRWTNNSARRSANRSCRARRNAWASGVRTRSRSATSGPVIVSSVDTNPSPLIKFPIENTWSGLCGRRQPTQLRAYRLGQPNVSDLPEFTDHDVLFVLAVVSESILELGEYLATRQPGGTNQEQIAESNLVSGVAGGKRFGVTGDDPRLFAGRPTRFRRALPRRRPLRCPMRG